MEPVIGTSMLSTFDNAETGLLFIIEPVADRQVRGENPLPGLGRPRAPGASHRQIRCRWALVHCLAAIKVWSQTISEICKRSSINLVHRCVRSEHEAPPGHGVVQLVGCQARHDADEFLRAALAPFIVLQITVGLIVKAHTPTVTGCALGSRMGRLLDRFCRKFMAHQDRCRVRNGLLVMSGLIGPNR